MRDISSATIPTGIIISLEIDVETARDEITILHDYVAEQFGYEMKYFRFPKVLSVHRHLPNEKTLATQLFFWSFAYADWDRKSIKATTETAFEK